MKRLRVVVIKGITEKTATVRVGGYDLGTYTSLAGVRKLAEQIRQGKKLVAAPELLDEIADTIVKFALNLQNEGNLK